jgi:hypothetical protein
MDAQKPTDGEQVPRIIQEDQPRQAPPGRSAATIPATSRRSPTPPAPAPARPVRRIASPMSKGGCLPSSGQTTRRNSPPTLTPERCVRLSKPGKQTLLRGNDHLSCGRFPEHQNTRVFWCSSAGVPYNLLKQKKYFTAEHQNTQNTGKFTFIHFFMTK